MSPIMTRNEHEARHQNDRRHPGHAQQLCIARLSIERLEREQSEGRLPGVDLLTDFQLQPEQVLEQQEVALSICLLIHARARH